MLNKIKQAVLEGEDAAASQLTKDALAQGIEPRKILDEALTAAMDIVGAEYESGERYVPEMLVSAMAMKAALQELKPLLIEQGIESKGKVILGTVEGDLHDIGKDLVAMMLEGAGYEVINLGTEISVDVFVEAVRKHRPAILGMSALLTTTMLRMPDVIEALKKEGLRDQLKVIIGGAPVTAGYAEQIEADGYAADAAGATRLVASLL